MARIPFKVSARAARLIGRENVATSHGAVTELVKNAYDADAGVCAVLFLPRWRKTPTSFTQQEFEVLRGIFPAAERLLEELERRWHVKTGLPSADRTALNEALDEILDLWIVDNGHGMSSDVINERWMVIGTDAKELNGHSNGGRVVTGAKGIGRFALDRLGRESDLFSGQSDADSIVHWFVDWSDFEGAGKIVSDVEALLEMESQPLSDVYNSNGLIGLLPKTRPIRLGKAEPLSFKTGTAIRIGLLNDAWDSTDSLRLKDTLASLLPPHERADFDIFVYDHRVPAESGFIDNLPPDQFDYRMVANVKADGTVSIKLERQEIDADRIRASVFDTDAMKQPGFTKEDFNHGYYKYDTDLRQLLRLKDDEDETPYVKVGPFDFTLYFFKLLNPSSDNLLRYPQRNFDVSRRRAWLKNSGGIRLYRDNFRVRPYGEPGSQAYDWLLLGEHVARNPVAASRVGWSVPPQQVAGTLYITKEGNPELDDQSNREGIRNERAFRAFREIVRALIGAFEHDRSYILGQFNAAYDRDNPPPPDVAEALRIVKQYRRDSADADSGKRKTHSETGTRITERVSSDIDKIGEALESKVQENEALREDNQVLRGMATLGTILVSFTHELKQIKADMEARGDRLASSVNAVVDPARLAGVPERARPLSVLNRMRRQDEKVSRWVDFALAAVSPAKRRRRLIDMQSYFEGLKEYWNEFLTTRKVELHLGERTIGNLTVLAHEIDLDSIFYNLINNSVEAFLKPSAQTTRKIIISSTIPRAGWVEVEYQDSGPGLSPNFNVAEDIFLFGVTSKKDDSLGEPGGTGIGMWLLRNVVDDYRGIVDLRCKLGEPGFKLAVRLPTHRTGAEIGHG
ncbi:ATP-binding protein [Niveispirillum sp. KHB5.9]|uniref:ATP-binding protein n=1 Tax=Niveispirillum sp. KHB5.9 TaxID=3400269 RepID=UPI003A85E09D